jgi:hypothetical protein
MGWPKREFANMGSAASARVNRSLVAWTIAVVAMASVEVRAEAELFEPYSEASQGDHNWGHQAADAGYWSFLPVLALGINADVFRERQVAALSLEGAAVLGATVIVPVVAAGALVVRRDASSPIGGCRLCRIAGWVSYGAMLIEAAVTFGLAFTGEIPAGLLSTTTILGSLSLLAMASDANQSWREARRLGALRASARSRFAVAPWAAPLAWEGNVTGGILGVGLVR